MSDGKGPFTCLEIPVGLGYGRHAFAARRQGLRFRFSTSHGETPPTRYFVLVQRGAGLGEQFGVGLAVTREQVDSDVCLNDIIPTEADMGKIDGEPPALGFEDFEPIGKRNVLGEYDELVPARAPDDVRGAERRTQVAATALITESPNRCLNVLFAYLNLSRSITISA